MGGGAAMLLCIPGCWLGLCQWLPWNPNVCWVSQSGTCVLRGGLSWHMGWDVGLQCLRGCMPVKSQCGDGASVFYIDVTLCWLNCEVLIQCVLSRLCWRCHFMNIILAECSSGVKYPHVCLAAVTEQDLLVDVIIDITSSMCMFEVNGMFIGLDRYLLCSFPLRLPVRLPCWSLYEGPLWWPTWDFLLSLGLTGPPSRWFQITAACCLASQVERASSRQAMEEGGRITKNILSVWQLLVLRILLRCHA